MLVPGIGCAHRQCCSVYAVCISPDLGYIILWHFDEMRSDQRDHCHELVRPPRAGQCWIIMILES